jgi:hypothetical protein
MRSIVRAKPTFVESRIALLFPRAGEGGETVVGFARDCGYPPATGHIAKSPDAARYQTMNRVTMNVPT